MIMVREASIYFRAEYWARPVRNGPIRDPMARFRVAVPEMLKLSPRKIMADTANTNRKITLFRVRIPG
jgi:hypothetical protein